MESNLKYLNAISVLAFGKIGALQNIYDAFGGDWEKAWHSNLKKFLPSDPPTPIAGFGRAGTPSQKIVDPEISQRKYSYSHYLGYGVSGDTQAHSRPPFFTLCERHARVIKKIMLWRCRHAHDIRIWQASHAPFSQRCSQCRIYNRQWIGYGRRYSSP